MTETPQNIQDPPAAKPKKAPPPAVVRMDKTRIYSSVHGERAPGDPWASVHFMQGGLPFDAEGKLIADHFSIKGKKDLEQRITKLTKDAEKRKIVAPGDDADGSGEERDPDDTDDDDGTELNLEAWARGEQDVLWQRVSDALLRRSGRRFTNVRDALEYMIAEGMVAMAGLSKANRKRLQD